MELVGLIVVVLIVWGFISNSNATAKRKEDERIKDAIRTGKLVRLTNGKVKEPNSLTFFEKTQLPDYQYLSEYGANYGFSNIGYLNIVQLKDAASFVRRKRTEVENERRRIEYEKQRQDEERRRLEAELKEKERVRIERANKWKALSVKVLFEINEFNSQSRKKGIYVIHCIADNRLYIGSSVNLLTRKSQHLSGLRNKRHHSYLLQEAFDDLDESNFKFYALQIIDENDLFLRDHYKDEAEKERALKKRVKETEQLYLYDYSPTFNIEEDTRGRRHWEGNSKYYGGYRGY
jgi:GIY-YIG catalytic domain